MPRPKKVVKEKKEKSKYIWQPHEGAQTEVLLRSEKEILFGGSRGGGKTDAGIAWMI